MKIHMGRRGLASLILCRGIRWEFVVKYTTRPLYFRKITPVPIEKEGGLTPPSQYTFRRKEKYLATAGIYLEPRVAQLVAQSLYQTHHLGPG